MRIFQILLSLLALGLANPAFADGWTPRIACDGGAFVVDGFHTYDRGFTDHQVVVRNSGAITYFNSLVQGALATNARAELIVDLNQSGFDGGFSVHLASVPYISDGTGTHEYILNGHWLDGSRYELEITTFDYYPGADYHAPSEIGNWIFNGCAWMG